MALVTLTAPAAEPVSLAELKDYLRIDAGDTSQDALLTDRGIAAREWAEAYTERRFITQQLRLWLDFFPGYIDMKLTGQRVSTPFVSGANALLVGLRYAISLPCPPVQSIDVFKYVDTNGGTTQLTANVGFIADLQSQPARLAPPFGSVWPAAQVVPNAIQIDYTAGYGLAAAVPSGIKTAIKRLTAHWFENRLPDENDIPKAVTAALFRYRDLRF